MKFILAIISNDPKITTIIKYKHVWKYMLVQELYKIDTDNYICNLRLFRHFFFLEKKLNDNYKFLLYKIYLSC